MAGLDRSGGRGLSAALAGAWFLVLALVVAGPLLGRGHLILLDFPAGPQFPPVPFLPLPSTGDTGNALPVAALYAGLREVWGPLPEKLILLVPVVVGGLGLYRLARVGLGIGALAATFGGTLYVVNPFLHDRYQAGHLYFALGYALLPWAVLPLVRALDNASRRESLVAGLWLGALGAVSFHVAGLYALLVVVFAAAAAGRVGERAVFALRALGLGIVVSAFWLLPFLVAPDRPVGTEDLDAFATRPDGFRVVPTLLALYGFWRREFTRPVEEQPWLYLIVLPILALVVVGAVLLVRATRSRRVGAALVAAGSLGVLLGAGTAFPPTGEVFRWLFVNIPSLGAYREPQKFLALTVVAYAVLGAVGLDRVRRASRRWVALAAAPVAFAAVLVYGHALLWGLGGDIQLSRYPASWSEANRVMERRGEGRLLFLPWWLYEDWPFTDGRIVASPAPSFFSGREVLVGRDIGLELPPASVDPFSYYVDDVLDVNGLRDLGRRVAPLDIRYVAWTEEADPADLQLLGRQRDLVRVYRADDLVLFENRAWRGRELGLARVDEQEPYVGRVGDPALPLVSRFPGWRELDPRPEPAVAAGERCNDGWRLGDAEARCHLGAVAAFDGLGETAPLWRPLAAMQVWALVVTLAAIAWAVLQLRRPPERRRPG